MVKERKHILSEYSLSTVSIVSKYGLDWLAVRFGVVPSTVSLSSEMKAHQRATRKTVLGQRPKRKGGYSHVLASALPLWVPRLATVQTLHPSPCYSTTKLRATIALSVDVGACGCCGILLSFRSPLKCHCPRFVCLLLKLTAQNSWSQQTADSHR